VPKLGSSPRRQAREIFSWERYLREIVAINRSVWVLHDPERERRRLNGGGAVVRTGVTLLEKDQGRRKEETDTDLTLFL
jgi:hypothetical protein